MISFLFLPLINSSFKFKLILNVNLIEWGDQQTEISNIRDISDTKRLILTCKINKRENNKNKCYAYL